MEIIIFTNKAATLKSKIIAVAKENKNKKVEDLKTWNVISDDGEDYLYHSPEQWNGVLLICMPYKDYLVVTDTFYEGKKQPEGKIATVYGRFIELLLVHFKDSFSHIEIHK